MGCHFLQQGSSWPRDWTHVSCRDLLHCKQILYFWAAQELKGYSSILLRERRRRLHMRKEALEGTGLRGKDPRSPCPPTSARTRVSTLSALHPSVFSLQIHVLIFLPSRISLPHCQPSLDSLIHWLIKFMFLFFLPFLPLFIHQPHPSLCYSVHPPSSPSNLFPSLDSSVPPPLTH